MDITGFCLLLLKHLCVKKNNERAAFIGDILMHALGKHLNVIFAYYSCMHIYGRVKEQRKTILILLLIHEMSRVDQWDQLIDHYMKKQKEN